MKTKKSPYYKIEIPLFPAADLKLCFNEKDFRTILRDNHIFQKVVALDHENVAETHYITDVKQPMIIVILDLEQMIDPKNDFYLAATVCHESTHAAQRVFDIVGEETPGEETRAYLTEFIFNHIMEGIKNYVCAGKRNRNISSEVNQKIIGTLLQMVEFDNGSAGQDSNIKSEDISSGAKDSGRETKSKTDTDI